MGILSVPNPSRKLIQEHIWSNAIELLAIEAEHLDVLHDLPYHHKDPFERLMIAQAIHEDLVLITKDEKFDLYDVSIEWSE